MNDGSDRPIAYASPTLTKPNEITPKSRKRDSLLFMQLRNFISMYLAGNSRFLLTISHYWVPCLRIKVFPWWPLARIQRWAVLLSAYNYLLQYCPGSKNGNADFMSRLPSIDPNNDESRISNYMYLTGLIHSPVTAKEIKQYSKCDPIIAKVIQYI